MSSKQACRTLCKPRALCYAGSDGIYLKSFSFCGWLGDRRRRPCFRDCAAPPRIAAAKMGCADLAGFERRVVCGGKKQPSGDKCRRGGAKESTCQRTGVHRYEFRKRVAGLV